MTRNYSLVYVEQVFFLTVNLGPLSSGELTPKTKQECDRETLGDLDSVYHLFPIMSEFTLPEFVTQNYSWAYVKQQVVFLTGLEGGGEGRRENLDLIYSCK